MDKDRHFPQILSSFWLKVVALLTMTIDHVGYLMQFNQIAPNVALVFRIIGRLAMPLFCFMIAEGAIHTKNFNKYALRLGIMASVVSLIIIGSQEIPFFRNNRLSMRDEGVIFIDLLLGAVSIYLLRKDKWYLKILAIIPLLYGIGCFVACELEYCGCYGEVWWIPYFMRSQYGWYAILLIVLFYVAHLLNKLFIRLVSSFSQIPEEAYEDSYFSRNSYNIIAVIVLILATVVYCVICEYTPPKYAFFEDYYSLQFFAILTGAFILLYNGLRGYNKKWFQYGAYVYFPLHLALIYLIFALL